MVSNFQYTFHLSTHNMIGSLIPALSNPDAGAGGRKGSDEHTRLEGPGKSVVHHSFTGEVDRISELKAIMSGDMKELHDADGGSAPATSSTSGASRGGGFFSKFFRPTVLGRCLNKHDYQPLKRRGDGDIGAGHVGRYLSLANPDRISAAVCHIPSIIVFSFTFTYLFAFFYDFATFSVLFLLLAFYVFGWATYLAVFSTIGMFKMRRAVSTNWEEEWTQFKAKNPGCEQGMLHFVVLPNYAEEEEMLAQTVQNIANNSLARDHMVCVLAMEAREGDAARSKANRLIERHQHLFKGMFATFHPGNIPSEVKGKSSNTQWGFREVQRWYGAYVSQNQDIVHDVSKVFITVADADSIHHKDYFCALTCKALATTPEDRSWSVWQPPILTVRNVETVPAFVRCSSYGTFLFEISGLVTAPYMNHCCFSAYTLTLALANHPIVDGWDADVIAEDYHMFIKCMCSHYWEQLFSNETNRSVKTLSKMRLEPIFLPVTSYLVEDPRGSWESIVARYNQARRHMQGIAELSYMALQHYTIARESREAIPWRVHVQFVHLMMKYITVIIMNTLHTAGLFFMLLGVLIHVVKHLVLGDLVVWAETVHAGAMADPVVSILLTVVQIFGPLVTAAILGTNFLAMKDCMEGRYCPVYLMKTRKENDSMFHEEERVRLSTDKNGVVRECPDDVALAQKYSDSKVAVKRRHMKVWEQIKLLFAVYTDMNVLGQPTLFLLGVIPLYIGVVGLSRTGHRFDYIVAAKPTTQKEDDKGSVASTCASGFDGV